MERRKYPRVAEALLCQVKAGRGVLTAETRNLSCGGALFRISKSLPLLTRLNVSFVLPRAGNGRSPVAIRCAGVVVRKDRSARAASCRSYLTAVFFSRIKPTDRRRIAQFVLERMLSS
ncbi:MAG: PilZ domain-containing protein [Candidatus Omnitrophica bacterium]|nr:PilZ domain-containing protein [Candidatus Omnitrophota bacterium]